MEFLIRPANFQDLDALHSLASSLSTQGFLTLPSEKKDLEELITLSLQSFRGEIPHRDQGQYYFVLEDSSNQRVIGSSLIVARHGIPSSPHLYFQVDEEKRTLVFHADPAGRTELGGLILDPNYRGRPVRLGKALSLIRFVYISKNRDRFQNQILAEFLPPFYEGRSPFWECLGKRLTGLSYREADLRARRDKDFFLKKFPKEPIDIDSLSAEAKAILGTVGPETIPALKIVENMGLQDLHQIDPFDGGPHYGAPMERVHFDRANDFFHDHSEVSWTFQPS